VPQSVHAAPGSSFSVRVVARDAGGDPTALPSGTTLVWTASPDVASISSAGDGAVVKAPTTIPAGGSFQVTVSDGTLTSGPATISLLAEGDEVDVPHTPPTPPAAVVLDAREGTCQQDLRWNVTNAAYLAANLEAGCSDPEEVAVFSTDHGVSFEAGAVAGVTGSVPPWTSGDDILARGTLPAMRDVGVSIRVHVHDTLRAQVAVDAGLEAIALPNAFHRMGKTGIEFSLADSSIGSGPMTFDVSDCRNATVLAGLGVDLTVQRLYVVYVQEITPNAWRGWSCTRMPGDAGAVSFVSATSKGPTTAAHEFGHQMGLSAPLPKDGHSGSPILPFYGFDYTNLMWVGEDLTRALPRTGITLGQAFRMNLDRHSWRVHVHPLDTTPKHCQCNPYLAGVCPVMYLDVNDVPPPPSTYPNPVCKADPWP